MKLNIVRSFEFLQKHRGLPLPVKVSIQKDNPDLIPLHTNGHVTSKSLIYRSKTDRPVVIHDEIERGYLSFHGVYDLTLTNVATSIIYLACRGYDDCPRYHDIRVNINGTPLTLDDFDQLSGPEYTSLTYSWNGPLGVTCAVQLTKY
jgi:hypothetical protein